MAFGQDEAPPLLGAYTLEGLGLAVDPTSQRLVPTHLILYCMPQVFDGPDAQHPEPAPAAAVDDPTLHGGEEQGRYRDTVTAGQPSMGWGLIVLHVLALSAIGNAGKMFPAFCYRREAHWRHRLAVAVGMWPRGEVGTGVLVLSLSYGIGGPIVIVAMLSLALNLALTGVFIVIVKRLIRGVPEAPASPAASTAPA